ncbi:MAG: type III-A CRISPR-associated RAMP protein Csm5 [Methylovulum sp.]|uniref:type III-A CRISPR-associated RAMP protein Csm5 n=1 Tax=Methylovulum sp. TaxID=1916980 RepID=UPI00261B15D8|nr:type III-A CRISPR-associated RAMP protein Csm5 [Methylovulum sp.]MDD2725649.1 type III-A CRISPR-associated RAMP protein Csm5 [Methylovulum sp.]MDD5125563.1 type III-A CRISPR-associated RAMP protein Csm5 [Methylovulum sp.]
MINPFLNTIRCTVSTLSPVHIGCGEDYYPTNYVIDDGFLHHFSEEGLLATLTLPEKNALSKIAEEQGDNGIKKLQQFIHSKKDKLQLHATHSVPLSEQLETFYKTRIGQTSQREGRGREVNNQLNIARHAFNPYHQMPYFAGSSIKGAIRTALLNALNEGDPLPMRLDSNRDAPKGEADKLQKRLLDYQAISDNPVKNIKGDPLRLLKIGDAAYHHADNLNPTEIRFAVNRKNKVSKFEAKWPSQLLECISANRSRSLIFDLSFLTDKNSHYRWSLRDICHACNEFFLPQLENELAMLRQLNYANPAWANGLEELLANELGDAFRNQQAFLLRVGQHGGAESNTLEGVRHIKIMQGKGNAPKYLAKPTTIWLAAHHKDQQQDLLPFGWVLVEIGDTVLDQTHAFLKHYAAADYQRQGHLQQLAKQRAEFLAQEQIKQALKAQQEAEAAEQQRLKDQAEAEKAAQLAEMTEAQRQIFELRQEYEKANPKTQPISGTLNPKLTTIANPI